MTGTLLSSGIYRLGLVRESELNISRCEKEWQELGQEVCTIMGSVMERMLSCTPGFITSIFFFFANS